MITPFVLKPDSQDKGCTDFTLAPGHTCWLTIGKLSLYISPHNQRLTVEVFVKGREYEEPIDGVLVSDDDVKEYLANLATEDAEGADEE